MVTGKREGAIPNVLGLRPSWFLLKKHHGFSRVFKLPWRTSVERFWKTGWRNLSWKSLPKETQASDLSQGWTEKVDITYPPETNSEFAPENGMVWETFSCPFGNGSTIFRCYVPVSFRFLSETFRVKHPHFGRTMNPRFPTPVGPNLGTPSWGHHLLEFSIIDRRVETWRSDVQELREGWELPTLKFSSFLLKYNYSGAFEVFWWFLVVHSLKHFGCKLSLTSMNKNRPPNSLNHEISRGDPHFDFLGMCPACSSMDPKKVSVKQLDL